MTAENHSQLANFIWSICNLLRGPYKRNEYRKVILPLTVLRRFDCVLASTKDQVLSEHLRIKAKPETVVRSLLENITGRPFYNLSKLDIPRLLDDPNQLAPNLNAYINGYSKNVREIMERFAFDRQTARMAENDRIVTRYMEDQEFQASAFPLLAREIFDTVRSRRGGDFSTTAD